MGVVEGVTGVTIDWCDMVTPIISADVTCPTNIRAKFLGKFRLKFGLIFLI